MGYEISIAMMEKPADSGWEHYVLLDTKIKKVHTLGNAISWIEKKYEACKKVALIKSRPGGPEQIGWIFYPKAEDCSKHPTQRWVRRDLVQIFKVERKMVFPWADI